MENFFSLVFLFDQIQITSFLLYLITHIRALANARTKNRTASIQLKLIVCTARFDANFDEIKIF